MTASNRVSHSPRPVSLVTGACVNSRPSREVVPGIAKSKAVFAARRNAPGMGLDELDAELTDVYGDLGDSIEVDLDRETKNELAMLLTLYDSEDPDELVRRAIHVLFGSTVDSGTIDFHLRRGFDVTYDEYLSGMTYDDMTGASQYPQPDDERRYQM